MLNEWREFLDYTDPVTYRAVGKQDTTWPGRFTFEALRDFSGLSRILTILARGFLFHDRSGERLSGEPRARIETARRDLCAWCSAPGQRKKDWQYQTDFARSMRSSQSWWTKKEEAGSAAISTGP